MTWLNPRTREQSTPYMCSPVSRTAYGVQALAVGRPYDTVSGQAMPDAGWPVARMNETGEYPMLNPWIHTPYTP